MSITIKIADSSEQKAARELVRTVYTQLGYLSEENDNLLKKARTFDPSTITLLALRNDQLVGTLSLVFDSKSGLPIDSFSLEEVNQLRSDSHQLCELSQFAVSQGGLKSSLLLCKYAKIISYDIMGYSDFVITVNPKHTSFYHKILKFDLLAGETAHPYLSDADAISLRLNLLTLADTYKLAYQQSKSLNLHEHFCGSDIPDIIKTLSPQLEAQNNSEERKRRYA